MNRLVGDVNLTCRALGGLVFASACTRAGAAEDASGLDAAGQVQAVLPAAAPDPGIRLVAAGDGRPVPRKTLR